jgi:hypothetical protein
MEAGAPRRDLGIGDKAGFLMHRLEIFLRLGGQIALPGRRPGRCRAGAHDGGGELHGGGVGGRLQARPLVQPRAVIGGRADQSQSRENRDAEHQRGGAAARAPELPEKRPQARADCDHVPSDADARLSDESGRARRGRSDANHPRGRSNDLDPIPTSRGGASDSGRFQPKHAFRSVNCASAASAASRRSISGRD